MGHERRRFSAEASWAKVRSRVGRSSLAVVWALFMACGPDPRPPEPCNGKPNFAVLITAAEGPLPEDTVVRVHYGGGAPEEFRLAEPGIQRVLFCTVTDREGNPADAGVGSGAPAGAGGEGGAATTAGEAEALLCQLWSYGSADLEVETAEYPMQERLRLRPDDRTCTVDVELELTRGDAGT